MGKLSGKPLTTFTKELRAPQILYLLSPYLFTSHIHVFYRSHYLPTTTLLFPSVHFIILQPLFSSVVKLFSIRAGASLLFINEAN